MYFIHLLIKRIVQYYCNSIRKRKKWYKIRLFALKLKDTIMQLKGNLNDVMNIETSLYEN